MKKILFVILISSLLMLSGCTSPFQDDSNKTPFEGCVPGQETTDETDQCTVDTVPGNNTFNITEEEVIQGNETNEQGNETNEQGNETTTITYGPQEGMHIQNFEALIHHYNDTNWVEFELYSLLNSTWNSSSNDSLSKWITIVFVSTDCSHCWNKGTELAELYNTHGDNSEFLVLAVNFSGNSNFLATP